MTYRLLEGLTERTWEYVGSKEHRPIHSRSIQHAKTIYIQ